MSHVSTRALVAHQTFSEAYRHEPLLGRIEGAFSGASAQRGTVRRAAGAANVAAIVARLLLGAVFVAAGVSGFVLLHNPPAAPPGLATAFQDVFFRSGWVLFVDGAELVVGTLLLINRFVPLALVALAGILYNIYAFHITMQPAGLIAPIVVTALWIVVAWPLRSHFAPLLSPRTAPSR